MYFIPSRVLQKIEGQLFQQFTTSLNNMDWICGQKSFFLTVTSLISSKTAIKSDHNTVAVGDITKQEDGKLHITRSWMGTLQSDCVHRVPLVEKH